MYVNYPQKIAIHSTTDLWSGDWEQTLISNALIYIQQYTLVHYKQTTNSTVCDYATVSNTAVVQFCCNKFVKLSEKSWDTTE